MTGLCSRSFLLICLLILLCTQAFAFPRSSLRDSLAEVRPDLARFFSTYGVRGTFVLLDIQSGKHLCYNPQRAKARFSPASTFKIFNSLVALETRVIAGVDEVIPWDSVDRARPEWNQDQRMREAFQRSTVWFYQELVRRIGPDRMSSFLQQVGYGNQDASSGVDKFWLTGALRISAEEQVEFLRRLHNHELAFRDSVMRTVEELLIFEKTNEYTMRGKTGWGEEKGKQIGWLVGWVERQGCVSIYAMNLETSRPNFPMVEARREITYAILRHLGVLPPKHP